MGLALSIWKARINALECQYSDLLCTQENKEYNFVVNYKMKLNNLESSFGCFAFAAGLCAMYWTAG